MVFCTVSFTVLCCCLAVNKAYKTLENEEGYKRCQDIVTEAKSRVDEAVSKTVVIFYLLKPIKPIPSLSNSLLCFRCLPYIVTYKSIRV